MPPVTKEMLEARAALVRTGGPGSVRRHVKVVHKSSGQDDKKVQSVIKRLNVQPAGDVDEITFLKSDLTSMIFNKPRLQANPQTGVYVVSGNYSEGTITEDQIAAPAFDMAKMQQMMQLLQAQQAQQQQAAAAAAA